MGRRTNSLVKFLPPDPVARHETKEPGEDDVEGDFRLPEQLTALVGDPAGTAKARLKKADGVNDRLVGTKRATDRGEFLLVAEARLSLSRLISALLRSPPAAEHCVYAA